MIDAQEKERQHIGLELHDNVNQILVSAQIILGTAYQKASEIPAVATLIATGRQRIAEAVAEIRKLSHELSPALFDGLALRDMLAELLTQAGDYKVRFGFDDRLADLHDEKIMINLYRVLQEQLKNIQAYAHAKKISVSLQKADGRIEFTIRDDGKGFDPADVQKGIGLANIRRRIESLSGTFELTAAQGRGCTLTANIPY